MDRTLLLVDDEENIISSLIRLLRRDGYRILRAGSGREALEILARNKVEVIISDQRMPEMTGTEFLSKVREIYPDTVRMVLSGYAEIDSITNAINRGAIYKFLTKPWDDESLRAVVEDAFRQYEIRLENARKAQELEVANEELEQIRHGLEQSVEEKTREAGLNLNALHIAQEVLDHLPLAVIGIGDDGMIALSNRRAELIFMTGGNGALLGTFASERLPPEVVDLLASPGENSHGILSLPNGRLRYWCSAMGQESSGHGVVLVLDLCD